MIDSNSCHPNIHTRLQRIAFWIEPENRSMLRDGVFEQDHINIVVKALFLLTRWFLPFQIPRVKVAKSFASPQSSSINTNICLNNRISEQWIYHDIRSCTGSGVCNCVPGDSSRPIKCEYRHRNQRSHNGDSNSGECLRGSICEPRRDLDYSPSIN